MDTYQLDPTEIEASGHHVPERSLMQAVIVQAVAEALGTRPEGISCRHYEQAQADARAWILGAGNEFEDACTLAGMDAGWIRARVRRFAEEGRRSVVLERRVAKASNGTNSTASLNEANP